MPGGRFPCRRTTHTRDYLLAGALTIWHTSPAGSSLPVKFSATEEGEEATAGLLSTSWRAG